MSTSELVSLISSIASLILAIIAIWLSIVFYRMSFNLSERANKAADDIASSVERLETLFNKLYSDTFSMVRETVTDMRKHIWPQTEDSENKLTIKSEEMVDKKLDELKKKMEKDVVNVLKQQQLTEEKIVGLTERMRPLLDKAIFNSRKVESEVMEEVLRTAILSFIDKSERKEAIVSDIVKSMQTELKISDDHPIWDMLWRMGQSHLISWKGDQNSLSSNTIIRKL